jgi:MFS transporter, PPP family, 3-phenylpropionic acid transporter
MLQTPALIDIAADRALRRHTVWRLRGFYTVFFVVAGLHMPFWPLWLASRGMDETAIGLLLAVAMLGRIVGNPVIGHLADAYGERKRPIVISALLSMAAFSLYGVADGFWQLFAVSAIFGLVWSGVMPMAESLAMMAVYRHKLQYGRIRLWGSASFMVTATLGGIALEGRSVDLVFWAIWIAGWFVVLASFSMPEVRPPAAPAPPATSGDSPPPGRPWPVRVLLGNRWFALFLIVVGLAQASHAVLYAFGTLHWRAAGLGNGVIGLLWAEGVIVEIVLFAFGGRLLHRFGPLGLLLVGTGAGVVRWLAMALTDDLAALVALQALHALTYAAAHLGAMHFIAQSTRHELSATAQSLYAVAAAGVAMGLAYWIAGPLYHALHGGAFAVMAGVSLAALAGTLVLRARWDGKPLG